METTNEFLKFTVRIIFQTSASIKTLNINKEIIFIMNMVLSLKNLILPEWQRCP